LLAHLKVLGAAAWGDVDDTRAFFLAYRIPQDNAMRLGGAKLDIAHDLFQLGVATRLALGF
jgi:hypothetical protein